MAGTFAEVPIPEMQRMLGRLRRVDKAVRDDTLDLAAPLILGEAQDKAPIRTGFLAIDSAFDARQDDGSHIIGFGANYALAVHETHPTKSRFLVRAVVERGGRIIRGALETALGRRIR